MNSPSKKGEIEPSRFCIQNNMYTRCILCLIYTQGNICHHLISTQQSETDRQTEYKVKILHYTYTRITCSCTRLDDLSLQLLTFSCKTPPQLQLYFYTHTQPERQLEWLMGGITSTKWLHLKCTPLSSKKPRTKQNSKTFF